MPHVTSLPGRRRGVPLHRRDLLTMLGAGAAWAVLANRGQAAEAEPPGTVPTAAEPHHHVLFETADLRVMRVVIPPGTSTAWHEHHLDYGVLTLRGAKLREETAGERQAMMNDVVTDSFHFGAFADKPDIRRVTNLSGWANQQVAFEILKHDAGPYDVADRSADHHYASVFDNSRLRVWRLVLQPGEFTAPVRQDGPGFRVVLSGDRLFTSAGSGAGHEDSVRAGDVALLAPGTRVLANTGNGPLTLIDFELK